MVRTRQQNPRGIQSPLQSLSNARQPRQPPSPSPPRGPVFPPGMQFHYDDQVGAYDASVSDFDLDGPAPVSPAPSDASADSYAPSVASDGAVHIAGEDSDDDEMSEPAVEIVLSDDEEEEDDDFEIIREVIHISDDKESDDEMSELDIVGPSPTISDPNRTISLTSSPSNQSTISDPDRINSPPPPRPAHQDEEDEEDDGIVDYQQPDLPPYTNAAPSHFERVYRGILTIWSVEEWAEVGERVMAEEEAERNRERAQRRRWAAVGGRSRLARQRAWRRRQVGAEPRVRVNGRFA
ncbi:hypothetical protein VTL71DRAFT_7697 [Oculimacula yallundae]|uniref:Uncharacterized protein n=1 Tax=Oculimacula yallundae TaxID=86028 RepID=A0ABR4BUW4_9HELO